MALPENEVIKGKRDSERAAASDSRYISLLQRPDVAIFQIYLWGSPLSGFGNVSRLFNRDQITKIEVEYKRGKYLIFDVNFVPHYHSEVQAVSLCY